MIERIHHVEMYVSNNHQAAHFYRTVFGFETIGTVNPEGGDRTTIALRRGEVRLLLTAPRTAESEVARHILQHGEGIKDVALLVNGLDQLFDRATGHGAHALQTPSTRAAGDVAYRTARVAACGALVHSLVERGTSDGPLVPGLVPADSPSPPSDSGIVAIDHIALALDAGELDRWVDFYVSALGLMETHQEDVSTEYSAMRSKVVSTPDGAVRFPMMEPAPGRRQSQIETYVRSHQGAGAQHLALRSHDIVHSVRAAAPAVEFLAIPPTYYDSLGPRVGIGADEIESLRRCGVLADRDATGILLQAFTKPIGARPTLFLELIERRGANGFGGGNIKALFEAVERSQSATS